MADLAENQKSDKWNVNKKTVTKILLSSVAGMPASDAKSGFVDLPFVTYKTISELIIILY